MNRRSRLWVAALAPALLLAGCGAGSPEARRVSVARRLPLADAAVVARIRPGADRLEVRALVESLALTPGVAAAEAEYDRARLSVETDGSAGTRAARQMLEASPVVEGFEP